MSIILIILLAIIICGAIAEILLARYQPRYRSSAAAIAMLLALVVWLFAGRSLPLSSETIGSSGSSMWQLFVDDYAWRTSFSTLLLVASGMVVTAIYNRKTIPERQQSWKKNLSPAIILLTTGATLLSIWAVSLPAIFTGWTLVAISWALLLWTAEVDERDPSSVVVKLGFILGGLLFLGLAVASQPNMEQVSMRPESWSSQARFWAMMAAVIQLGALPLHFWRPMKSSFTDNAAGVIHIIPAVAGVQLLIRLSATEITDGSAYVILLTAFGLLGILYGTILAWSSLENLPIGAVSLALAQTGVILLAAAWAGTETVFAASQVFILATGSFFLLVPWSDPLAKGYKIPMLFGVAAMAGIPLTAGFYGLAGLYRNLAVDNRFILALVTALLITPLLAAATLQIWFAKASKTPNPMTTLDKSQVAIGVSLPALGLLVFPTTVENGNQLVGWLLLFFSSMGAVAISLYMIKIQDVRTTLTGAFHLPAPSETGKRLLSSVASVTGTAIREAAAILEGEGGMLWLLLLVVILWLARSV